MEDHDSIDLRSKEFQEIIGEPPSWLLRWGITTIFISFIGLIIIGYFFKYPETISASISFETANPPIKIKAHNVGTLIPYFREGNLVEANNLIGRIENINSGNYEDIAALDSVLNLFSNGQLRVPDFNQMNKWELGPMEGEYLKFYQAYIGTGNNNSLQNQTIQSYNENIRIYQEDVIELNKIIAGKQLRLDKIPQEIDDLKKRYSDTKEGNDYINLTSKIDEGNRLKEEIKVHKQLISNKNREIKNQENQKSRYLQEIQGKRLTRKQNIDFAASTLRSKIDDWKINHLIRTPIAGTLVYQDKLQVNSEQFTVEKGESIFAIIPKNARDSIEGKLFLSTEESIKIEIGQPVKIKINAFRPSEYGMLNGIIFDKTTIPENGQYLVRVKLLKNMLTTKGKTIPFEHQMQGEAQIITKDRRFTGLIYDQFIEMLNR